MHYRVYADLLFILNLVVNATILWAAGKLAGVATTAGRIWSAAALGAAYALAYALLPLFPGLGALFTLPGKLVAALIMVAVAYNPAGYRSFIRLVAYTFALALLLAGSALGVSSLAGETWLRPGGVLLLGGVKGWALGLAVVVGLLLAMVSREWLQRRGWRDLLCLPAEIVFGRERVVVQALLDTGNQLRDPLSRSPVMIVEYEVLRPVLPVEVRDLFERPGEPDLDLVAENLGDSPWRARFRVIPFASLGSRHGLLLGFRPDEIIVHGRGQAMGTSNVIIGIYNHSLCPEGSYRALLHPDILKPA